MSCFQVSLYLFVFEMQEFFTLALLQIIVIVDRQLQCVKEYLTSNHSKLMDTQGLTKV